MVTDAAWMDYDKDGKPGLDDNGGIHAGKIFHNQNNTLKEVTATDSLAYTMQSAVFFNNKNGTFTGKALPVQAQLSPMYGIATEDFDKDSNVDISMGGNFYQGQPQVGIYDASYGVLLKGNGKGDFLDYLHSKGVSA